MKALAGIVAAVAMLGVGAAIAQQAGSMCRGKVVSVDANAKCLKVLPAQYHGPADPNFQVAVTCDANTKITVGGKACDFSKVCTGMPVTVVGDPNCATCVTCQPTPTASPSPSPSHSASPSPSHSAAPIHMPTPTHAPAPPIRH